MMLLFLATSAFAGAICNDGWVSDSTGSGTCSHHRGVAVWTYDVPRYDPVVTPASPSAGVTSVPRQNTAVPPVPQDDAATTRKKLVEELCAPTRELTPLSPPKPEPKPRVTGRFIGLARLAMTCSIYAEPNVESEVIGKAPYDSLYNYYLVEGEWLQVNSGRNSGWVKRGCFRNAP